MNPRLFLITLGSCLVASCAHKPPLTLEQLDSQMAENKKSAARIYKGKSIDQVRSASQRVLCLLDPPDMQFDVQDNELLATRFSTFYAVFSVGYGRDWYSVTMKQLPVGVESRFGLTGQMNAGPFPTFMPVSFKSNIPISAHDNPNDFNLFHDRVEYILGIRDNWPTCEEAKKMELQNSKGMALCDLIGLDDKSPNSENQ